MEILKSSKQISCERNFHLSEMLENILKPFQTYNKDRKFDDYLSSTTMLRALCHIETEIQTHPCFTIYLNSLRSIYGQQFRLADGWYSLNGI